MSLIITIVGLLVLGVICTGIWAIEQAIKHAVDEDPKDNAAS